MIKKIISIARLAVFQDFKWDRDVRPRNGHVPEFKRINIIYGRNYSGKTSLSRIIRAMETGGLPDKIQEAEFCVELSGGDGTRVAQNDPQRHSEKIRVYNEDFVRDNLHFISDPDDGITPFAVLGSDNTELEAEIADLERELGSSEEENETGLYAQRKQCAADFAAADSAHTDAHKELRRELEDKATRSQNSIKSQTGRYDVPTYSRPRLEQDLDMVVSSEYQESLGSREEERQKNTQREALIEETTLEAIPLSSAIEPSFKELSEKASVLVTQEISPAGKIEELLNNDALNQWVQKGAELHQQGERSICAFCNNQITEARWKALKEHFDEASEALAEEIDTLLQEIAIEKERQGNLLSNIKEAPYFYSKFHQELETATSSLQEASRQYGESLDELTSQLEARRRNITNLKEFLQPSDASGQLREAWKCYRHICEESNQYTGSLGSEQKKARRDLLLSDLVDYAKRIQYRERCDTIEALEQEKGEKEREMQEARTLVQETEESIRDKKEKLTDEKEGAQRVNEYLDKLLDPSSFSLEARQDESTEEGAPQVRFHVLRDGAKAYHLSEGECSLLAFCYFLAKLEDIDTKDSKPIIWIDDPVSSLDGNHIFFIYSLIASEIVDSKKFKQLTISTHNLEFLRYLKSLEYRRDDRKGYFMVVREDRTSTITPMPKYLQKHITEFNYLFEQIYKCANIGKIDDTNYKVLYGFGNNARKFLEIYLFYNYPNASSGDEKLEKFFSGEQVPAILTSRMNNEYSHLTAALERGQLPVDEPEMQIVAKKILERIKATNRSQYDALCESIGVTSGQNESE